MIVIQIARAAFLSASFFFMSYQAEGCVLVREWAVKHVDKSRIFKATPQVLDDRLLARIKSDYQCRPVTSGYDELVVSAVYKSREKNSLIVFLDVKYVDDIQIVYEIDGNEYFVDKYVYSQWKSKAP